jgi:hypothetical protein
MNKPCRPCRRTFFTRPRLDPLEVDLEFAYREIELAGAISLHLIDCGLADKLSEYRMPFFYCI